MPPSGTPGDFDPAVRRLITAKARRLVGRCGLRPQDRPDVEQDLAARVADRLGAYQSARGTAAGFAAMVIEQAAANLLRDRGARKRTPPRPTDLPTSPEDVPDAWAGRDERHRELAADVAAVLAELPDDLRALAERLKTRTLSRVARETGVPRTSLYRSVAALRQVFERKSLMDYL